MIIDMFKYDVQPLLSRDVHVSVWFGVSLDRLLSQCSDHVRCFSPVLGCVEHRTEFVCSCHIAFQI